MSWERLQTETEKPLEAMLRAKFWTHARRVWVVCKGEVGLWID